MILASARMELVHMAVWLTTPETDVTHVRYTDTSATYGEVGDMHQREITLSLRRLIDLVIFHHFCSPEPSPERTVAIPVCGRWHRSRHPHNLKVLR